MSEATCPVRVYEPSGWGHSHLCGRLARHDGGARCGIHCAAAEKKRKDKRDARYRAWQEKYDKSMRDREFLSAAAKLVRAIADGHNDPRSACVALLVEYGKS